MEDPRLALLIDWYISGALNAAEHAELHHRLSESSAAREQFELHTAHHMMKHPGVTLPNAHELLLQWNEIALIETTDEPVVDYEPSVAAMFRASFRKWRVWSLAGTGVALAVATLTMVARHISKPAAIYLAPGETLDLVATLRHSADVQWTGRTNEIFVDDAIAGGHLQFASGTIGLEFKRGARVIVEGPADLQLISDNEAFLHSGRATAHVPEAAHGFKITAPAVAVTDLGTEFGLKAAPNLPTEIHVFSGAVEMARPARKMRRMTRGEATSIHGKRTRDRSADRNAFVFEDELLEREADEQRARHQRWKKAAQALSTDAAALVHYTFEDQTDAARRLANHSAVSLPSTIGDITGCNWEAGRWPEKRALTFAAKTDRVRFTVPTALTSLTYMAWLRVDRLANSSNALALTETMNLGEVHWQIYRDGRVALSARSGNGATVEQSWDRGISPAIFTADRLGKWTQLVSVYDSTAMKISHYVNGTFLSNTPIKRRVALKLGAVEIGNWGVKTDQPTWSSLKNAGAPYLSRNLNGCIDEFALLSRAMSAEEIRRYYEQGRIATGAALARK